MLRTLGPPSGLFAVAVYVFAVVLGGALRPDYDHVSRFVSELIGAGAPNKAALDALFAAYNLAALLFAAGVVGLVRPAPGAAGGRLGRFGAWALVAQALLGLATLGFPQDPIGGAVTATGTAHIVLAGLNSLATMLAMLGVGLWLVARPPARRLGRYTLVSLAVVFVSGGLAAALTAQGSAVAGLLERVTIGAFLQWVAGVAVAQKRGLRLG